MSPPGANGISLEGAGHEGALEVRFGLLLNNWRSPNEEYPTEAFKLNDSVHVVSWNKNIEKRHKAGCN